jgi:cytochrome-b5 reductase
MSGGKMTDSITTHTVKKIGMIAGGTGITPMLQVIKSILKNPADKTEVSLIFANQTEEDIFLRQDLEELAEKSDGQFKLWYTVDSKPAEWTYSVGYINADMISKHLPAPAEDVMLLLCGPPPMIKFACKPAFSELGHSRFECF